MLRQPKGAFKQRTIISVANLPAQALPGTLLRNLQTCYAHYAKTANGAKTYSVSISANKKPTAFVRLFGMSSSGDIAPVEG